ncbi:FAS1-like dehydratase domain-containing protein [Burkholderia ubonensis]|uniref:FAS1-like dehydratase domain-containing protein n=2 Tax=Burkholderia ubonensis TaxID=101571 RepID=UPI000759D0BB|nr:MaoC family dehydratase N-terminal domain-containing protein [Burkholderia ubonensis]KWC53760.1 acyl-CoA dehydrogenase [Burkholderia ubonensis]KWE89557.1 acyl-CoA dehydrogenase [Burkholderia ubonensis]KWI88979.1 acyl-CoA dehydrogenase [Burkholderia ubonensis]
MNAPRSHPGDDVKQVAIDLISAERAAAFAATLDHPTRPVAGDALPPAWHWLYFWSIAQQSELGPDGHPRKGGFLPDLGLPRRMWAGGRLTFERPLTIGQIATRTSRVLSIERKQGRSGPLGFVTVEHVIESAGTVAIREEHDIVYRGPAAPGAVAPAPQAAPDGAQWQRDITPDEVLLFRYSALTFNGHRIHYDRAYARDVEGYPDLVVHGPLISTLLLDLVTRSLPGATVREYAYRAVRPSFVGNTFSVCGRVADDGKTVDLWAKDHDGLLTMSARATLA